MNALLNLPATPKNLVDLIYPGTNDVFVEAGYNKMMSLDAQIMLTAIALQESGLATRRQYGNGPAAGLWQFEESTPKARGGVWALMLNEKTKPLLIKVCQICCVEFDSRAIWLALQKNDIFAAACARLLLWADPLPLPRATFADQAWVMYAVRTWRPGKPHPERWAGNWAAAVKAVLG